MTRGGKRPGAGRPKGQGKYGEPTKAIRVPESMVDAVVDFITDQDPDYALPFYGTAVSAGFPSPADDHITGKLDLNQHLIQHPSATFFVRVSGESMLNAGIHPGDILIVDRSLAVKPGKVVIAAVNGELTVKRLTEENGQRWLSPENDAYEPIAITEQTDIHLWGVVTNVIHNV